MRLRIGARVFEGPGPFLVGIVNVTPDSFSDGGRFADPAAAVEQALALAAEGADLVDVGGESTRPGAPEVPAAEEIRRVVPVIERLRARAPSLPVSVDTSKLEVARAALDAGADLVNDVRALAAPGMAELVAGRGVPAVLMHMRGTPADMATRAVYGDVVGEVAAELARRVAEWRTPGKAEVDADYAAAGVPYRPRGGQFQYPEDLLQVLGVSYPLYDRVRDLITVRGGSAGVAPQAASLDMLTLLAGGDRDLAARIASTRGDDPTTDMTGLASRFLGGGGSSVYRVDARVKLGERSYRRTRWIDLSQGGADGTPWRSFRVEPVTGSRD